MARDATRLARDAATRLPHDSTRARHVTPPHATRVWHVRRAPHVTPRTPPLLPLPPSFARQALDACVADKKLPVKLVEALTKAKAIEGGAGALERLLRACKETESEADN
eukprot:377678-Prymnesium_polylepis.1